MGRTADKIAHLRKTAFEHPEYIDVLLPFEEIFAYVDGKETGTGIRFDVPDGDGAERVRGGIPLLSPEALSVDRDAAAAFLSGLLDVLRRVGREGHADLDRIQGGLSGGSLDLASLYVACLARKRDVVDQAAASLSVQAPLLAFVLEIPLKAALEGVSSSLPPERFDGWKEGYCPVCGSRAGMAELSGDEGRRRLSCSACFFLWSFPRIQCPYCGNADPETLSYFTVGDGPTRVGVCRNCSRYIKTRDARIGNADVPLEAEDLATLHLDLLAGKEGFEGKMSRLPGDDAKGGDAPPVLRYDGRRLAPARHLPVREVPVTLTVNGVALATLIASPHDLHFLVAGFLRMQGLIRSAGDLLTLSVCDDFGSASVRIRGDVPDRIMPTYTSGCGAGISFHVPASAGRPVQLPSAGPSIAPESIFSAMDALARASEAYRGSGGIHSAGAWDGDRLLLFAEDIGRHNTIDRIAGQALLGGIDLSGRILVASGRVSSEMAAKSGSLGISVIASLTSPTDLAVRICVELGITLVGYVRGRRFNVYTHPSRIAAAAAERIPGVTGVILAGGRSGRMGSDKALLPYQGGRFIEAIHRRMEGLFDEVIVATGETARYDFLPCRRVTDLYPGMGALGGIHAGLRASASEKIFVVACDMPHFAPDLIRHLCSLTEEVDVVVPEGQEGIEPLHAVYRTSVLPAVEDALRNGQCRVVSFFDRVRVRRVPFAEVERIDPDLRAFRNINTPEEYYRFRDGE